MLCPNAFGDIRQNELPSRAASSRPNVILFYVDDLGYGDLSSYGADRVSTPNIDNLAAGGVRFTDAHSAAATCTPSRYALLTGEHGFRARAEILPGDATALIRPEKPTLAKLFKNAGYQTAVIGKWHLGLGDGAVDWNTAVKPGPGEVGFDYSFLIPATGDRVPTVYLEGHHVVSLDPGDPIRVDYSEKIGDRPTGEEHPELLRFDADAQHSNTIVNGVSRIGYMSGGESALWVDEEFPELLTGKAVSFINENRSRPFFLFYSFHDIHVPRLPHERFQGATPMGPRGDAIVQTDWVVGEIVRELEELSLHKNTLIIFTSDNGPVLNDGYEDGAVERLGGHQPAGPYRGGKYSLYEAGTRVPTITNWPGTISPKVSDALVSQLDIYASIAKLLAVELQAGEATDSIETLPVFLGHSDSGRTELLEESFQVNGFRQGRWKYIPGTRITHAFIEENKGIEGGFRPEPQLYDLAADESESENLAEMFPEKVVEMDNRMKLIEKEGYSGSR
jgi:arylsulfatase A-like enzyme